MEVYVINQFEIFLQLGVAALLGMLLGAERSIAGKTAGMRTYGIVSMGACLFIIVSVSVAQSFAAITPVDPLRILEGVITGVGFIGAGIIIFKEAALRGLTTAAGLWIAAGVGISVGYGLYSTAIFATLLTLFLFTGMWFIERRLQTYLKGKMPAAPHTEDNTLEIPHIR